MADINKDTLNSSITKAITILNCFTYDKTRLRLKDISQMTGINQATAHRMLNTLKEFNLIEQDESSYSLGRGFLKYEGIVLNSIEIRRIGLPYLEELSNSLRVNVNLAILDENEVVYVARAETPFSSYAYFHIGMRRPVYCTALGKVLTCKYPEFAQKVIRQGITRLTMNTIIDEEEFLKELEKVRLQGYAVDFEELSNGINCVAVPIRNASGDIIAAISISGPTSKYPREKILDYIPSLMNCANRISSRLGARGNW